MSDSVERAQQQLASAQYELDDSIANSRSDIAYRRSAVAAAQASLDEAVARRADDEKARAADAAARAGTYRATVLEYLDASSVQISVEGRSPSYARLGSGIYRVDKGDTVDVVSTGGTWQIVNVVTQHPTPVVDSSTGDMPPKPSSNVPVPGAPTTSSVPSWSSITPASLNDTGLWVTTSAPSSYDPAYINRIRNALNAVLDLVHTYSSQPGRWPLVLGLISSIRSDLNSLQNAQNSGTNAINGLRSGLSSAGSAIAAGNNYTEDVGEVAAEGGKGITNATAQAGVVSKVPRWSFAGIPAIIDGDWEKQRSSVRNALAARITAISEAYAVLDSICDRLGTSGPAGWTPAPAFAVDTMWWSSAATAIQAVDDWANGRVLNLRSKVAQVLTLLGLPAAQWSSLTYGWSNTGTSEGSTAGFRGVSVSFAAALSNLGTYMSTISRTINDDPNR